MNDVLKNSALIYAEMGFKVLRLKPAGKEPMPGSHGCDDATTDEEQINAWWTETPNANIGLATDGLCVVDVDGKNNPWLDKNAHLLDGVPTQKTGNDGRHYMFTQPAGENWTSRVSGIAEKVDTRANKGYIVVAPSTLGDGKNYEWLSDLKPQSNLQVIPDGIIQQLKKKTKTFELAEATDEKGHIRAHTRDATLLSLAGQLRRIGMQELEIRAAISAVNQNRCYSPGPLPDSKIEDIARYVSRHKPDDVAQSIAEGGVYLDRPEDAPKHPGPFPRGLLKVPGLVSEVIEYNLRDSIRPQPIFALAGALALVATLTGRKIRDTNNTRTNAYIICIGGSGCGKDRGREVNNSILHDAGLEETIGPEKFTSGSGIHSALKKNNAILCQIDELGRYLQTCSNANPSKNPWMYSIIDTLLKLYSSAGSRYHGEGYADASKNPVIDQPHLVILGTSVPQSYYESMSVESLTNGFLGRIIPFETDDPKPPRNQRADQLPSSSIIAQVQMWAGYNPCFGNLSHLHPRIPAIPYTAEAQQMIGVFEDECDQRAISGGADGVLEVWSRVPENTRKLALLYGCSACGPALEKIDAEAIQWACELSMYLCERMLYAAHDWISDSRHQAEYKKVFRKIKGSGPAGLDTRRLIYKTTSITKRQRDEIVDALLATGEIKRLEKNNKIGRRGACYIATENVRPDVEGIEA